MSFNEVAYKKEYYLKNKQRFIDKAKVWALANKEQRKIIVNKYSLSNREKLRAHAIKYRKENPLKYLLSHARRRAKRKGQAFNIELSDLSLPKTCPLLGIPLDSYHPEQKYHPSIDRIDSTKGYIKGNVIVISHRANMLKNNATASELSLLARNLYKIERSLP